MELGNYNTVIQIGKGACGSVYLVRNKDNKKVYALKKVQLDESRKTRTKEAVLREARIMSELKHPHIVTCHASFFDDPSEHLCLVLDYCDGGTLDDKIKAAAQKQQFLPEKQVIQWFLQLALAVRYMHSCKVLHRDLKTENVFINKNGSLLKLGDFGIAKSMDQTIDVAKTCVGTPCYLSPEMCQDIPYSSKADVWALGCMLYEMCALKPAFDAHNLISLFYKIVHADFEQIPDFYSKDMQDLVNTILSKVPEERPSARGVLLVPFLRRELVKFIEEKEFILEQRRLPTRQGSRPYSTPVGRTDPNMNSVKPGGISVLQRAISCRALLVVHKEKSQLSSGIPDQRNGRVSTIPEESEDHALEKSVPLEKSKGQIQLAVLSEKVENHTEPDLKLDLRDLNESSDEHGTHNGTKTSPTSPKSGNGESSKSQNLPVANKPIERVRRKSGNGLKNSSPDTGRKTPQIDQVKQDGDQTKSPRVGKKGKNSSTDSGRKTPKNGIIPSEKVAVDSGRKTPKNGIIPSEKVTADSGRKTPKVGKIECEKRQITSATEWVDTPSKEKSKVPHKNQKLKSPRGTEPEKKHKIQEPLRTPRVLEPNPLQIQTEPQKSDLHENKLSSSLNIPISSASSSSTSSSNKSKVSRKDRCAKSKSLDRNVQSKGKHKLRRRDSAPGSLKKDCVDYYSDDFDDSSGSEIEEEIPEELPCKTLNTGSNSLTFEIPEIPEELPDGMAADDDDNDLEDDLEEVEEELDEVVNMAKEAQEDLDYIASEDELIIADDQEGRQYSASIQRHCLKALGKEKYETVKEYCENMSDGPSLKKLEKVVGKENMKTVFLMREVSKMSLK